MAEFFRSIRESDGPVDAAEPEVRLAVYDSPLAAPRVVSLRGREFHEFVGDLATRTYNFGRERGGRIPYIVIREIIENLIHAYFQGAVISILDDGNTASTADQGRGVPDKVKALHPGSTPAPPQMRRLIKGVGSGLPVAREQLAFLGGAIAIDNNLTRGTVVTLTVGAESPKASPPVLEHPGRPEPTPRQKKVLLLIAELGSAGPSAIAKELAVSRSTAYRELHLLARWRLVDSKGGGKRTLTEEGIAVLGEAFKP